MTSVSSVSSVSSVVKPLTAETVAASLEDMRVKLAEKDALILNLTSKIQDMEITNSKCCSVSFIRCQEHRPKRSFIYSGFDSFEKRRKQLHEQNPDKRVAEVLSPEACNAITEKYKDIENPLQTILDGIARTAGKGAVLMEKEPLHPDPAPVPILGSLAPIKLSLQMPGNPSSPPCRFNLPPAHLPATPSSIRILTEEAVQVVDNQELILNSMRCDDSVPTGKFKKKSKVGGGNIEPSVSSAIDLIDSLASNMEKVSLTAPVALVVEPATPAKYNFMKKMTIKELKEYCKDRNFKGFSKHTTSHALIEFIKSQPEDVAPSLPGLATPTTHIPIQDMGTMKLPELKLYAKSLKLKGISKFTKKADLVKFIIENKK
jgi:hypothetical protein